MTCNLVIFGVIVIVLAFLVPIGALILAGFGFFPLFEFFWDTKTSDNYMTSYGMIYTSVFFIAGLMMTIYGSSKCEKFNNIKKYKSKSKSKNNKRNRNTNKLKNI